jgi:hypothetical protein
MRLDVFFLFLEKTRIIGYTTSKAGTLLDTFYTKKRSVQDFLGFAESHNHASTSYTVKLGPVKNTFPSSRETNSDSIEILATETLAAQV